MTVAELIAKLQKMPQDAPVTFRTVNRPGWHHEARRVRQTTASDGEFGNWRAGKRKGSKAIVVIGPEEMP
jgi:hypothetical protein